MTSVCRFWFRKLQFVCIIFYKQAELQYSARQNGMKSVRACPWSTYSKKGPLLSQRSLSHTVSRVMSLKTVIYLGYMSPYNSSVLPEAWRATITLLHGLASDGVYNALSVTGQPVVSYTAISPLPSLTARRYTFCCTFLRITPTWRYQASCPVKPGLSSPLCTRHKAATVHTT